MDVEAAVDKAAAVLQAKKANVVKDASGSLRSTGPLLGADAQAEDELLQLKREGAASTEPSPCKAVHSHRGCASEGDFRCCSFSAFRVLPYSFEDRRPLMRFPFTVWSLSELVKVGFGSIFPKQLVCKGPLFCFRTSIPMPFSDLVARGPVVPWSRGPSI